MRLHLMPKICQVAVHGEHSRWLFSLQWSFIKPWWSWFRLFYGNGLHMRIDKTWRFGR